MPNSIKIDHFRRNRFNKLTNLWLITYSDLLMVLLVFFVLLISASDLKQGKIEKIMSLLATSARKDTVSLSKIKKEVQTFIVSEGLVESVSLSLEDDGLEVRMDSGAMFDTASAVLKYEMLEKLRTILSILPKYQHKYHMAVEGHADKRPLINGPYKSNWELSSERAMRVRELVEHVGVKEERIRVEAYGDTKPLAKKHLKGLDQKTILSKHRRVVIRVY